VILSVVPSVLPSNSPMSLSGSPSLVSSQTP